jgi:hypothetical protein
VEQECDDGFCKDCHYLECVGGSYTCFNIDGAPELTKDKDANIIRHKDCSGWEGEIVVTKLE